LNTGKDLEVKVYETLKHVISEGKFGISEELSKVYINKGYYSKQREQDIIVDVSVELFLPGSDKPSIIWVWECKDHSKNIPVGVLEEFHTKLQQIGADNTKGTVITQSCAYQRSAYNFAKSNGIGLARLMPDKQIKWVMYDMFPEMLHKKSQAGLSAALTTRSFTSENRKFFGVGLNKQASEMYKFEDYIEVEFNFLINELKAKADSTL
jgi:hypothetical protein